MAMICRYAFPTKVQPVDKRPHSLPVDGLANLIFCRFALHSQHPQGSRHLCCMLFNWQHRPMVHRIRDLSSFSATLEITLLSLLFELSPCPVFEHTLLLVWDVTRFWIPIPLLKTLFFRFSFRGMSDLSPFPFPATTQVMENNVFTRRNLTGQLYLVCKNCWIHLRHVSTLCEPCRGCEFFERIGWELWTPGHGWTSLLRTFRQRFFSFIIATHWAVYQFNFYQEWSLLELFCIHQFKGVTPLGRHTRPACN